MKKHEYIELHRLLAKLKYELVIEMCEMCDKESIKEYQENIKAIDNIMQVFILDDGN